LAVRLESGAPVYRVLLDEEPTGTEGHIRRPRRVKAQDAELPSAQTDDEDRSVGLQQDVDSLRIRSRDVAEHHPRTRHSKALVEGPVRVVSRDNQRLRRLIGEVPARGDDLSVGLHADSMQRVRASVEIRPYETTRAEGRVERSIGIEPQEHPVLRG